MNLDNLRQAFELMLIGMGGVFLVLCILYGASELLIKYFPVEKD